MQGVFHAPQTFVTNNTGVNNQNNSIHQETRVTTADDVRAMIGSTHYDDRLSVEKNVVNALVNGFFLAEGEHTLRGLTLEHNMAYSPIKAPRNVVFDDCFISSGIIKFYHGKITATGTARTKAEGPNATAFSSGEDAESFATKPGAKAYSSNGATAYATTAGAEAFAMDDESDAYGSNGGQAFPYSSTTGQQVPIDNRNHLPHFDRFSFNRDIDVYIGQSIDM